MFLEWKAQQAIEAHSGDVTGCDFSGNTLVTCSNDKTVRLWTYLEAGTFVEAEISPFLGHKYGVNCVRFSPFGIILASCSIDGMLILWNAQTGEQVTHLQHPSSSAIRVCCFSPSGALLATGSDDETVIMWDVSTRSLIRSLVGHGAMVAACSFSPDSTFLMSGGTGGDLKLWDARYGHGKCLFTRAEAHDLGVAGCDFSPQYEASSVNGALHSVYIFASCGNDDFVKVWRVQVGLHCAMSLCYTLEGHSGNVMCCRFSPDGSMLGSTAGDKTAILWDAGSGEVIQKLEKHSRYVPCCAFSFDCKFFATGSNDRTTIIWCMGCEDEEIGEGEESRAVKSSPEQLPVAQRMALVAKWTVEEVCRWLSKIDLDQYCEAFKDNCINGQELLHLTHDSLNTALKIEALGHRTKLLREIQTLKNPLWQHYNLPEEDGSLPDEFYCPITHELMKDPAVSADGYSYEKAAILEWLESGKDTSPMTNEVLEHTVIIPNKTLHLLIQKYLS